MRKRKKINERTWGTYEVLEDRKEYKIQEIIIQPDQELSAHSHDRRTEIWAIIAGRGTVILEEQEFECYSGRSFFIPTKCKHGIKCIGDEALKVVEVQIGDYLKEDDVKRDGDGRSR